MRMARQNVSFATVETIKKPARVKFKTKSGETVSFKVLKTVRKKKVVHFRAKKK
jgi:hypothetical protein